MASDLEAVHAGHLHVEQRERHVVLQKNLERLFTATCFEEQKIVAPQERFERDEIFFAIVYQEKFDRLCESPAHGVALTVRSLRRFAIRDSGATVIVFTAEIAANGIAAASASSGS